MSFFSSSSDYALGIDFGTQSIKAVELKVVKEKVHLVNYAWVDVANAKEVPDVYDSNYAKRLQDALGQLVDKMKPNTKEAVVSVPSFNGLIMVVDFPRMSEKDMADAIQFESRKYIPASFEDVNVDWQLLEKPKKDESKQKKDADSIELKDAKESVEKKEESQTMKVLLAAAPKSEVQYYDNLFANVDISIPYLELESFALVRSVIGNAKGRFVLVDIGARTTNIILINDGIIYVNRSVDIGGFDITNTVMKSMNISRERAIDLKKDGHNFFTGATKIGFPSLNNIGNEVKRILASQKSDKIESLVLCGGGSKLAGLSEYLSQLTGLTITIGNPLSHIVYDEKESGNVKELRGELAVAIGLALHGIKMNK